MKSSTNNSEIIQFSEETKTLVLNTVRGKNFIMVYQPFIKKFGVLTGYYLSLLLDQYEYHSKHNQLKDGMFYLTHEHASKMMNEKEYSIKQAKKKLKEAGFLYFVKKGIPSKEYIGINFNKIKDLILNKQEKVLDGQDPKFSGGQGVEFSGGHYIKQNLIKLNLNKGISTERKKQKFPSNEIKPDPKEKQYLSISKKLAKIISKEKKINCNSNIKSWCKPIRLLMTKDLNLENTDFKQIKKRVNLALNFYKEHIGEEFIPVIHSGNSLREKFIKLENAMQRENKDFKKKDAGNRLSKEQLDAIKRNTIVQDF